MRLTVLGASPAVPNPGCACSSYLVEAGEDRLVLDLGTGAFANLRCHISYTDISAVAISHMHADHFIDVIPYRYALKYGWERRADPLPLLLPPGGESLLRTLVSAFAREGNSGDFLDESFAVRTYDPERPWHVGSIDVRFAPTRHYIPAYAMRVSHAGRAFVFSADTAPSPELVELARGADALLCEATLEPGMVEIGERGHSNPAEAALMAREAGVPRLIITHYPQHVGEHAIRADAERFFEGEIVIARDHLRLEV
ncbi:MAG TPA: MBL fold metallo-hydrolase [Candidatus Dormibacteraeota bacterium]|nr:MBL fold metallo-hydrolase [Candidatus Dormibacteraeota bacterium]